MNPERVNEPRRWMVPRPGPDGEPLGVLRIEVVPSSAWDHVSEQRDKWRDYAQSLEALLAGHPGGPVERPEIYEGRRR